MTTAVYNPTGGEPYMQKTLALGTVPGASFGYKARLPVEIEDCAETYLRGAWVTVGEYEPAREASVKL